MIPFLSLTSTSRAAPAALRYLRARIWGRAPLEWYVDSVDCAEALFRVETFIGPIVDPCCGQGNILLAARRIGLPITGRDVVQRRHGVRPGADEISDFFRDDRRAENVVCNPPYDRLDEFIDHALQIAERKVAVVVPLRCLGSQDRAKRLGSYSLAAVYVLSPRPSMPPGEALKAGIVKASGGTIDYAWIVFERNYLGEPRFGWAFRRVEALK